jgi:hypothetical protein
MLFYQKGTINNVGELKAWCSFKVSTLVSVFNNNEPIKLNVKYFTFKLKLLCEKESFKHATQNVN